MRSSFLSVVLCLGALAVACGGENKSSPKDSNSGGAGPKTEAPGGAPNPDEPGEPPSPPKPTRKERELTAEEAAFVAEFAQAECAALTKCCDGHTDVKLCEAWLPTDVVPPTVYDNYVFRSDFAAQCLVKLRSNVACPLILPFECRSALRGDAAPEATCADDRDCALGREGAAFCSTSSTCALAVPAARGGACEFTCEGPLCPLNAAKDGVLGVCDRTQNLSCVDAHCGAPRPAGETCSGRLDCVTTAFCDFDSRTCVQRKAAGNACREDEECVGYCAAGQCADRKPAGADCSDSSPLSLECTGQCSDGKCAEAEPQLPYWAVECSRLGTAD
jgi:hypothetical protein